MASTCALAEAPTFSHDSRCFHAGAAHRQRRCSLRRLLRAVRCRAQAEKACVAAQEQCSQHADGLRASRRQLWTSLASVAGLAALQCPQACLARCLLTVQSDLCLALWSGERKSIDAIAVCSAREREQQGFWMARGECWAPPRSQSRSCSRASSSTSALRCCCSTPCMMRLTPWTSSPWYASAWRSSPVANQLVPAPGKAASRLRGMTLTRKLASLVLRLVNGTRLPAVSYCAAACLCTHLTCMQPERALHGCAGRVPGALLEAQAERVRGVHAAVLARDHTAGVRRPLSCIPPAWSHGKGHRLKCMTCTVTGSTALRHGHELILFNSSRLR